MQALTQTTDQLPKKSQTLCAVMLMNSTLDKLSMRTTGAFPPIFKHGMKPTPSQIETIKQTVLAARNSLSLPATAGEITEQFSLLSGAMRLPRDMDGESAGKAYMIALEGCSSWSIRESVIRIIKGNAVGFNKTFMPAAPELAAYCKKLEEHEQHKISAIERCIRADEEQSPAETITAERFEELQGEINKFTGAAA